MNLRGAALVAGVFVGFLALGQLLPRADHRQWACSSDRYAEAGEALVHGVYAPGVSWQMPLGSVWAAALCYGTSPRAALFLADLARGMQILLIFTLGWLLRSRACGLWAAAIMGAVACAQGFSEQSLYGVLILLTANLLVWWARRASPARAAALGAAIGVSLCYRSPLALLPPLLAAVAWKTAGARRRDVIALLVVPYLFLFPWMHMNWQVHGRFIPLEDEKVRQKLVTAALGVVPNIGRGDWQALAAVPPERGELLWSAQEILRHPARYARSCLQRAGRAAALNPMLLCSALLSLWMFRRSREHALLGLLAAYFFAVHCLIPMAERYFEPLWPLLAVLAACAFGRFLKGEPPTDDRLPWAVASICLCLVLILCAYTLALVCAFPRRIKNPEALDQAALRNADDAWLLSLRGRRLMSAGRPAEALRDFSRACLWAPDKTPCLLDLAWAHLALGDGASDLIEKIRAEPDAPGWVRTDFTVRVRVLETAAFLQRGRRAQAALAWEAAKAAYLKDVRIEGLDAARPGTAALGLLSLTGLFQLFRERLAAWPDRERLALLEGLEELGAIEPRLLIDSAQLLTGMGRRAQALKKLARAEKPPLDLEMRRALARSYFFNEAYPQALRQYEELLKTGEHEPFLWLELAVAARETGALERSAGAIQMALAFKALPFSEERRTALLYQRLGHYPAALDVFRRRAARAPLSAEAYEDLGVCELLAGSPASAAPNLQIALGLDPRRMSAYLSLGAAYSALGRDEDAFCLYEEALSLKSIPARHPLRPLAADAAASIKSRRTGALSCSKPFGAAAPDELGR